jgi:hypothetical protein
MRARNGSADCATKEDFRVANDIGQLPSALARDQELEDTEFFGEDDLRPVQDRIRKAVLFYLGQDAVIVDASI